MIEKSFITCDAASYGATIEQSKELIFYINLSNEAYNIFIKNISSSNEFLSRNALFSIYNLQMFIAKNTSYSIRLLSTWAQPIEAYALLRIRLEQLIICSYLIYESPEQGLIPYMRFAPKVEQNISRAMNNELLTEVIEKIFPEHQKNLLNKRKSDIEKQLAEDFEFFGDKLKRKWTELKVNELAKKRDELIPITDLTSSIKLELYYNTLYKMASSIVHSDAASISNNFITKSSNGILMPHILYIFTNIFQNALFDITQCYEVSKYLNLDISQYTDLYNEYQSQIKIDFGL